MIIKLVFHYLMYYCYKRNGSLESTEVSTLTLFSRALFLAYMNNFLAYRANKTTKLRIQLCPSLRPLSVGKINIWGWTGTSCEKCNFEASGWDLRIDQRSDRPSYRSRCNCHEFGREFGIYTGVIYTELVFKIALNMSCVLTTIFVWYPQAAFLKYLVLRYNNVSKQWMPLFVT